MKVNLFIVLSFTHSIRPLTRILHQAESYVLDSHYHDPAIPALCALRWFPIREQTHFKLALLMYKACTLHKSFICYVTPCSSVPFSAQHLMESMWFLAR